MSNHTLFDTQPKVNQNSEKGSRIDHVAAGIINSEVKIVMVGRRGKFGHIFIDRVAFFLA